MSPRTTTAAAIPVAGRASSSRSGIRSLDRRRRRSSESTNTLSPTPADRELRTCVPHGSLPTCGGGTGRGVEIKRKREPILRPDRERELRTAFGLKAVAVPVLPLSLSLPHKGGGNVVAPHCLSPTNAPAIRSDEALAPA